MTHVPKSKIAQTKGSRLALSISWREYDSAQHWQSAANPMRPNALAVKIVHPDMMKDRVGLIDPGRQRQDRCRRRRAFTAATVSSAQYRHRAAWTAQRTRLKRTSVIASPDRQLARCTAMARHTWRSSDSGQRSRPTTRLLTPLWTILIQTAFGETRKGWQSIQFHASPTQG